MSSRTHAQVFETATLGVHINLVHSINALSRLLTLQHSDHSFRMEDLRSTAFAVYLSHALVSALAVESVVNQRKHHHQEVTFNAVALWVRYCRNAQGVCGPFGIAAIDRAESMVLYRFRHDAASSKSTETTIGTLHGSSSYPRIVSRILLFASWEMI
jgi:hypothetical protein